MTYFLQGLLMGLAYIAPIGVQNLFVVNSALSNNYKRALLNAWIVFLFDLSLSLACFYGVGYLLGRYRWLELAVLFLGGAAVLYMGVRLAAARGQQIERSEVRQPWLKTASYACVVTWFNPQAVLDGTMILGAFHASLPEGAAGFFIGGVICASWAWFTGLTLAVYRCRRAITPTVLLWINRFSGAVIFFYGCSLLQQFLGRLL